MYKFLIPLFVLALLIGCTPKSNNAIMEYNTSSDVSSGASSDVSSTTDSYSSDSMQSTSASPSGFNGEMLTGKHTVILKTSLGDITLELDADKAPKTVTNFAALAQMGYYNELTFHRVIPGFMIQGGDPNGNGTGGQSIFGESFEDEANDLQMNRGVIAMANRGPDTNGSQFFITVAATTWLQGRHTIFGKVVEGMDIVDKIANTPVVAKSSEDPSNPMADRPKTPVTYMVEVKK